jgi:hypothetical protein
MRNPDLSTKAKRNAVAKRFEDLAARLGVTFECTPNPLNSRSFSVELSHKGYHVAIWLNADSHVGAYLGHWHTASGFKGRYPVDFWRVGALNTYHYGKATTCCEDLDAFLAKIEDGFALLQELDAAGVLGESAP